MNFFPVNSMLGNSYGINPGLTQLQREQLQLQTAIRAQSSVPPNGTPPRTLAETAAPAQAQTAAPSQAGTAAPAQAQTAAPSQAGTSAPSQAQMAAAPQAQMAAPSQPQTAAAAQGPTPTQTPSVAPPQAAAEAAATAPPTPPVMAQLQTLPPNPGQLRVRPQVAPCPPQPRPRRSPCRQSFGPFIDSEPVENLTLAEMTDRPVTFPQNQDILGGLEPVVLDPVRRHRNSPNCECGCRERHDRWRYPQ